MKKKILSILLAAIMIVGILPTVAFAGTISTVADVLATVEGGFPTRPAGQGTTVPENAWKNTSGDILYSWAGDLEFVDTTGAYFEITNSPAVTEDNGNYKYTISGDGWEKTITFNMENGVLVSVNVVNTLDHISEGLYTAPVKDDCTYTQKVKAPENGKTYGMKLNCKDKGEFTFEANGKNWNIKNSNNKYLNAANGKLVLGDTAATAWTYKNGAFSTSVKTTQKNNGYWLGFLYIPGRGSKTVTTTYYLSRVDAGSLSTYYVGAELYTKVSGDHSYKYVNKCNGTHDKICTKCGERTNEKCTYAEDTHKCDCGAYNPEEAKVEISVVDGGKKTTKQYVGIWPFGRYKEVTTYTATIKTEATGVKVRKVEYQLNGGKNWVTGTSVCSNKAINSLKVRVTDNKGNKYYYEYPEAPAADFTVTFNMNGHGDPISSITNVTSGATIDKPTDPTAEGYVFKGWFKEEACENEWNFESDTVTKDTTLYAKWNITLGGLMASQTNFPADEDNGWAGSSKTSNKLYYAYHEDVQDTLLLVRYEHTWTGPFRTSELTPVANGYIFSFDNGKGYSFTVTFNCDAQNKITSITITGDSNVEDTYAPASN